MMANVEGAREEIQKVISFFVTRFGSRAEVFEHLTRALSYLNEPDETAAVPAEPTEVPAAVEPEPTYEVITIEADSETLAPPLEEPAVVAEVAPAKGARRGRRGRTKRT